MNSWDFVPSCQGLGDQCGQDLHILLGGRILHCLGCTGLEAAGSVHTDRMNLGVRLRSVGKVAEIGSSVDAKAGAGCTALREVDTAAAEDRHVDCVDLGFLLVARIDHVDLVAGRMSEVHCLCMYRSKTTSSGRIRSRSFAVCAVRLLAIV